MRRERELWTLRCRGLELLLASTLIVGAGASAAAEKTAGGIPSTTGASPASASAGKGASMPVDSLSGTVRAIDLGSRTLTLMTGVGYSLRVVRVVLPQGLAVRGMAPDSSLARVTPGCVVRVECTRSAAGRVAKTMTVVRSPRGGQKP